MNETKRQTVQPLVTNWTNILRTVQLSSVSVGLVADGKHVFCVCFALVLFKRVPQHVARKKKHELQHCI